MAKEKVLVLQQGESRAKRGERAPEEILKEVKRDMGKVALIVSIMAVMLMVVFYFSLKLTVGSMEKKVAELYPLKKQVVVLDKTVGDLQNKMTRLEDLPEKTRKMIFANILNDLSQKTEYLSSQMKGAQREKLLRIESMLKQLQRNMK